MLFMQHTHSLDHQTFRTPDRQSNNLTDCASTSTRTMPSSTHRRATPVGHEALRVLALALLARTSLASTPEFPLTAPSFRRDFLHLNEHYNLPRQGPPEEWDGRIPLKVTNACPD